MADDREIVVGSLITLACSCEFITEEEKKTFCLGEKVMT